MPERSEISQYQPIVIKMMEKRPTIDAAYSVIDITERSEASACRDSNDGKKAYSRHRPVNFDREE